MYVPNSDRTSRTLNQCICSHPFIVTTSIHPPSIAMSLQEAVVLGRCRSRHSRGSLLQEVIVLERAWQELVARAGEPEELEVREILGMISSEWEDNWWKKKLVRIAGSQATL